MQDGYRTIAAEGLLGPDHNIVHGNYSGDDELAIIVDAGASVTSTAIIELRYHVRPPLSGRVRKLGAAPSIGIDSEVVARGDMFDVMHFALHSQRLFDNQDTIRHIESGENADGAAYARENLKVIGTGGSPIKEISIKTREVLDWAITNNAKAMRLDHRIGSLTPGKQADLIILRRDNLHMLSAQDPVEAVVHYAQSSDVDTVIIAGDIKKSGGHLTFQGLEQCSDRLLASAARLLEDVDIGAARMPASA